MLLCICECSRGSAAAAGMDAPPALPRCLVEKQRVLERLGRGRIAGGAHGCGILGCSG